jgi:hypothetical protein
VLFERIIEHIGGVGYYTAAYPDEKVPVSASKHLERD